MAANITFQYHSLSGATFDVSPSLVKDIGLLIDQVRGDISAQQTASRFIGYLSVPVSSKSGGDFQTNLAIAAHVTQLVQEKFGKQLWILNPAAYNLPKSATGGDYMAVWSDVLAGVDGNGTDFDLAYFVGPNDIWSYFGVADEDRLGKVEKWLSEKAATSADYKKIYDDVIRRQNFVRYYGLRGSSIYSKGSHDEWNIVVMLNSKRAIGDDIAVYFDGEPIEPGDYQSSVPLGYQTILH